MAGDESGCSQLVAVVQAAQFHCRHPGPHHTTIASTQSSVLLLDVRCQYELSATSACKYHNYTICVTQEVEILETSISSSAFAL